LIHDGEGNGKVGTLKEKVIKRFKRKEGREASYHPSAVKGGTSGSGSFAVMFSQ
jgi:hypothetical protein